MISTQLCLQVFELKLKNTQLKKKLLRTENELANAQIQYITTRNQTLYPYNAEKDAVKAKHTSNSNSNIHNGLDFLNHFSFDPRRAFDSAEQVSFVNASNIISGPKALRRGLTSEFVLDSLKDDNQQRGGFNRSNITEELNNTLDQLNTNSDAAETNNTKSTLDNFFPYSLNLFPSFANNSAATRENSELISSPSLKQDLISPPSLKEDLSQRAWGDVARFNGENSILDMSIPSNNKASFADTILNSNQQYDNSSMMEKQKNFTVGGGIIE
ncbi:hypothetical protein LSTR_LSTR013179 [Laodelphax striatellus]|uniref:Uncharacterized protein n=1 Tax=Laodelphax striatellus TaxID=195883 RepID=A0A482XGF1_LAOST|nr:hypothetical protein LSTR_LSTR013179 [Laodelphax striatellus]